MPYSVYANARKRGITLIYLADLAAIHRTGPLIDLAANHSDALDAMAGGIAVTSQDALHLRTESAVTATAWLLRGAHDNALGPELRTRRSETTDLRHLFGLNRLLGFRGQCASYPTIIPSLFRRSQEERQLHGRARDWFSTAISAWHNSYFCYAGEERDRGGVEREPATGVAQHYGIATSFVDWTWDPVVAVAFAVAAATPGEQVSVFIRPFGPSDRPHEAQYVFLPPSFAGRIWRQRGFFSWQPVAPEYLQDPQIRIIDGGLTLRRSRSADHHRISFPVAGEDIEWAKPRLDALYQDDYRQLLELADWCVKTASDVRDTPRYSTWCKDRFVAECERLKRQPPSLFTVAPPNGATGENLAEMMDYLDLMSLRRRPAGSRLAYHMPALLTALMGLPKKSFLINRKSDATIPDKRISVLPSSPIHLYRWSKVVSEFNPAQDLLAPSDAFFVDHVDEAMQGAPRP